MTAPRSQLISPAQTPYYHCIARCVRRSWLCGEDTYTGKNFNHRKPWLLQRLALLAEVFAIHVAGYAVMSNHYHLVLCIDQRLARSLSDDEVIDRWQQIFTGPPLVVRYRNKQPLTPAEQDAVRQIVAVWRQRLASISWFMRCLNEYIARMANAEDGCKGRFWEGRFKSQALLDERALLACMAYVDLNPIRAGIAETLDSSDYTSIQARVHDIQQRVPKLPLPMLLPFAGPLPTGENQRMCLPYALRDYLELVDWTGRCVRNDRKGVINHRAPRLLQSLALDDHEWRHLALSLQKKAIRAMNGWDRVLELRRRRTRFSKTSKS